MPVDGGNESLNESVNDSVNGSVNGSVTKALPIPTPPRPGATGIDRYIVRASYRGDIVYIIENEEWKGHIPMGAIYYTRNEVERLTRAGEDTRAQEHKRRRSLIAQAHRQLPLL